MLDHHFHHDCHILYIAISCVRIQATSSNFHVGNCGFSSSSVLLFKALATAEQAVAIFREIKDWAILESTTIRIIRSLVWGCLGMFESISYSAYQANCMVPEKVPEKHIKTMTI